MILNLAVRIAPFGVWTFADESSAIAFALDVVGPFAEVVPIIAVIEDDRAAALTVEGHVEVACRDVIVDVGCLQAVLLCSCCFAVIEYEVRTLFEVFVEDLVRAAGAVLDCRAYDDGVTCILSSDCCRA